MQFSANREELLAASRKLARLLPDQSPIADLTGILLEADENDGSLRLVATNLEVTLQYRFSAAVAQGGRMVLNGKLLAGMMPLLSEDTVFFRTGSERDTARIENGKAYYEISCLSGNHYPEPKIAAPDSTVKVQGLALLAGQTAFAAMRKAKSAGDMLVNARLEVFPSEVRMTCTDGSKLAIARNKWEASNEKAAQTQAHFLLPIKSLPLMADVCGDEVAEIGVSGTTLVVSGANYRYTMRTMSGIYPDTNALLSQIKPAYHGIVGATDFWTDVDRVSVLAGPGDTVGIALQENGISLSYQHEDSSFSSVTAAVVYSVTPESGFHYSVSDLYKTLRYMHGNLSLSIDKAGNMLLKTQELCYLLVPRRARKAASKAAKTDIDKKKTTTRRKKAA